MAKVRVGVRGQRSPALFGRARARFISLLLACFAPLAVGGSGCTQPTFASGDANVDRGDTEVDEDDARDAAPSDEADTGPSPDDDDAGLPSMMDTGVGLSPSSLDGGALAGDARTQADAMNSTEDAGPNPGVGTDGGAGSPLPSWALPLIGKYAKRSVTFSYDANGFSILNTRNVEYSILTISQRGEELAISIELCAFRANGTDSSIFYIKNPAGMPKLTGRIVLGAPNTFSSERMVHTLGFDPGRATCGAGGKLTRYADQSWSAPMCECLGSPLPDSLNDCRVIDGDSDSRPGITGRGNFVSASLSDVVMTFQYAVTFVEGQVKTDQTHELREVRTQSQACLNPDSDACNFGNNTLCSMGATTKLLHREDATCANFPEGDFDALPPLPSTVRDCR